MENNEDKGTTPSEPKITAPPAPPRRTSGGSPAGKWIAVIIALLVVIGVLGGLLAVNYHPAKAGPTGPSAVISATNGTILENSTYTATINATGSFNNMTVFFGNGNHTFLNYKNSNSVKVSTLYKNPGQYYILAEINYSSSNVGYYLNKVTVAPNLSDIKLGYRPWTVNPDSSSTQLYSSISNIFAPGDSMQVGAAGFSTPNAEYQIVQQTLTMNNLSGNVGQLSVPYYYNYGNNVYTAPITTSNYNNLQGGMYMLNITTESAHVNVPQTVSTTVTNTHSHSFGLPLNSGNAIKYSFNSGSSVSGKGSQNLTYGIPMTNVTYSMGDNVSFVHGGTLNLTSATNVTIVSGSITVTNSTTTYTIDNSKAYYDLAAGDGLSVASGTQVMFNTAAGAFVNNAGLMTQNFNGNYTLGFTSTTGNVSIKNNAPASASSSVTYDAGTAFTNLNGTEATLQQKTNTTVTNGTQMTFKQDTQVILGSTANITSTMTPYNAKGAVKNVSTMPNTYLLTPGNYTFKATSTVTFNSASTQLMFNMTGTSITFGQIVKSSKFTLQNMTTFAFTSVGTNTMVWVPVSISNTATGTGTVALKNGNYNHNKLYTTTYWEDFPVTPKVTKEGGSTSAQTFTNAEPNAPGGYTTLDPSLAYYTADSEILDNTLLQMFAYNGSSTSSFVPQLVNAIPSESNGGINTNHKDYNMTTPWGTHYEVKLQPGQNYTFHFRNKTRFMNGSPVTAWDAMYTLTRTLLFDAGSPGTPGWIFGQYMLPGDYFSSNTFYNITTNMTVYNNTNTLHIHFQTPMPLALVEQIFAASGSYIEPAAWFQQHGAGITWSPAGFAAYQSQGNLAGYNTYVENHIMPDGPYQISYIVPGSEVVLVKNPNYVAPNSYYKPATINRVNILYLSSNEQAYLLFKSGQADNAALPTTYFNQTKQLVNSGQAQIKGFPTLGVYFYTFTTNVNMSLLTKSVYKNANMPSNLFLNPNARKAFAYAYNYSEYYQKQVGNEIYNTTFLAPFAGMLPTGMLFNQSIAQLSAAGANVIDKGPNNNGLANFQKTEALHYWNVFMNSTASNSKTNHDSGTAMGISYSSGQAKFNGKSLNIPIMIPSSDPVDKAAVTTWGADLAQVIPGITVTPVQLPLTDIFSAYAIQGQNPMPISWGGWAPDYPYPTDYLLPMGLPLNGSTYMGPAGYVPSVVGNTSSTIYNMTEYHFMQQELSAQKNATNNATSQQLSKKWFQKVNGMIVNSTVEVYIGQQTLHWTMSSRVNGNDIINNQENVMIGGGQDLLYNLLSFNTTK